MTRLRTRQWVGTGKLKIVAYRGSQSFARTRGAVDMTSRTICDILRDLKNCHKTRNYSYLPGILEELQWAANRMEAALEDQRDLINLKQKRAEVKDKLNDVQQKLRKVQLDLGDKAPGSIKGILDINLKYF